MKFIIAFLVLIFAVIVYQTNGLCNTCSAKTNLACVAEDQFKVCQNGLPTGEAIPCPTGSYCSSDYKVCDPELLAPVSCAKCKTCDVNNTFACTKYNAFSLCKLDGTIDATTEYECPAGLVCNYNSPRICVDGATLGMGATCAWSTQESTTSATTLPTTPDPQDKPAGFCAAKGVPGSYEVPTDLTCKKFIRCRVTNTTWSGDVYICPNNSYFNQTANSCGANAPARCQTASG